MPCTKNNETCYLFIYLFLLFIFEWDIVTADICHYKAYLHVWNLFWFMNFMILKDAEAKWQNELVSRCQTLSLKDVTITYLCLFV